MILFDEKKCVEISISYLTKINSLKKLCKIHKINPNNIYNWCDQYFHGLRANSAGIIRVFKDEKFKITHSYYGTTPEYGEFCTNKNDFQLYPPEVAKVYRAGDELSRERRIPVDIAGPAYCHPLNEFIYTVGRQIPVFSQKNYYLGSLVNTNYEFNFKSHSFLKLTSLIHNGFLSLFLNRNNYSITLKDSATTVRLNKGDLELILYRLFGFSSKELAVLHRISFKTIDNKMSAIKDRIGICYHRILEKTFLPQLLLQIDEQGSNCIEHSNAAIVHNEHLKIISRLTSND